MPMLGSGELTANSAKTSCVPLTRLRLLLLMTVMLRSFTTRLYQKRQDLGGGAAR